MKNPTLFSMLLQAPWWTALLIAVAVFGALRLMLPDLVAAFAALPFIAVAAYAGWRALRTPAPRRVETMLATLHALSWEDFSTLLAEAFSRDGYAVTGIAHGAADLELRKDRRLTIAACRRWKAGHTGIGPLRELYEQVNARNAQEGIYVTSGVITANARAYAAQKNLRLLSGTELARLVLRVPRSMRHSLP